MDHGDPLNGGPRVARRFNDLDTGQITGGIYSWYDGKSDKTAFSGKVTKFADNFLGGSHDFKLGVQYNSGLGEYTYGPNDYIYTYGATPAYGYTQLPYTQGGRMKAFGVFVDDTYQIGRATLNLGLRYDDSKAYFARAGSARRQRQPDRRAVAGVDEVFRWRVVSPRLGVNFKLNESGTALLKAHYGRYYRGIVTGEFDNTTPSITPRLRCSRASTARPAVPLDKELVSDNSTAHGRSGLEESVHRPVHRGLGAAGPRPNIGFSVSYVHKRSERPDRVSRRRRHVPAGAVHARRRARMCRRCTS